MSKAQLKRRVGELRPSQLIFTFGIGSIVELPYLSVMVMGLDDWHAATVGKILEPRLLQAVQQLREQVGGKIEFLAAPPVADEEHGKGPLSDGDRIGVPVSPFPNWVYCPYCNLLGPLNMGVFKLKANPFRPDRAQYVHENCQKAKTPPVLPARFLVSCNNGHLQDFPWREFLHQGVSCEGALKLYEFGTSGQASEVVLKCEGCGQTRNMSTAFAREQRGELGACQGRRPHLRDHTESCSEQLETVLAGSSNVWFPLRLSVLSIPESEDPLAQLVIAHQSDFSEVSVDKNAGLRDVGWIRKYNPIFEPYSATQIWDALQSLSGPSDQVLPEPDLKRPEWSLFSNPQLAPKGTDLELEDVVVPKGYERYFEKVVLAKRLREVHAFVGFTRLESEGDFGGLEDLPAERWVKLSRKAPTFVPATEVRGEGIFLQFRESLIESWLARPSVIARSQELFAAHEAWRRIRDIPNPDRHFPGMRYVLLHTFAHALMRQLALECGYSSASIRERLYSHEAQGNEERESMAGVLLYTATPDSEGTLGGLVETGRPENLVAHIQQALEVMGLCSSDPLCAEQLPLTSGLTLHGAACHACLFAPETSCERGNKYLDRNSLVPTLSGSLLGFFQELAPVGEVSPPAPKVVLELEGSIPILDFLADPGGKEVGRCNPEDFGVEEQPGLFAILAPHGLEQLVAPGTLCLLQELSADDELPPEESLVLVRHPSLKDPDWGPVSFRRFIHTPLSGPGNQVIEHQVTLRPRTSDKQKYRNQYLTFSPDEWSQWRPLGYWRAHAKAITEAQ